MVLKQLLSRAKSAIKTRQEKLQKTTKQKSRKTPVAKTTAEDAPNRFLKFYYANRKDLLRERKEAYYEKAKKGICVRCSEKAVSGIKYCTKHQAMQREYNRKAREKREKKETRQT